MNSKQPNCQNLLQIAQNNDTSQEDTKKLAKSFFDITAGGGDYLDGSTAEFFELIYQKFPKSKILKNYLIDIYGGTMRNRYGTRLGEMYQKCQQNRGNFSLVSSK